MENYGKIVFKKGDLDTKEKMLLRKTHTYFTGKCNTNHR